MRAAIYARVSTEGQQQRGTIGSRPDDATLARLILDEYIRFPDEAPRAGETPVPPAV